MLVHKKNKNMKSNFDNVGFSQEQTRILSLPLAERAKETDFIRRDPVDWMDDTFDLTATQYDQLVGMDSNLLNEIATAVADTWDKGNLVSFNKASRPDSDQSPKDLFFSRQSQQQFTFSEEPQQALEQVSIWIRYR
ncbi:hypothetical protein FAZ15_22150 [Sphingobacterium olei]|uniref:Uncharacterized protein n=1 Tax=Sphingobacterium olei TaxID=2571155 RepID=A0A4U0N8T3_9SPHI|nr:hypothetical protein FAZ15_22150 [Sphingobacterium olei]